VPHVQPPVEILERMITIRLHLDDCNEDNGALRVLPGTHCLGRLTSEQIGQLRRDSREVLCRASAGDALLMRPLLLHASSRSRTGPHRRVLHIDYAGVALPEPLEWGEVA
jgi:ectoine hydroxylase-related dioxygenase (phytanoyl-CoA dioxygenase family)